VDETVPLDDRIIAPGSFNDDYDQRYDDALSEAQARRYLEQMSALDELRDFQSQAYVPVIYRGVGGIFVPESSLSSTQGGPPYDWRDPYSVDEVQSAADQWSLLVLQEVKKALDEYDLVSRLAEQIKSRRRRRRRI